MPQSLPLRSTWRELERHQRPLWCLWLCFGNHRPRSRHARPTPPVCPPRGPLQWGTYVLALVDGERKLLMQGSGASPEGNK